MLKINVDYVLIVRECLSLLEFFKKNQSNVLGTIENPRYPFIANWFKIVKPQLIDSNIQSIDSSITQKKFSKLKYEKQLTDFTLKICFSKSIKPHFRSNYLLVKQSEFIELSLSGVSCNSWF